MPGGKVPRVDQVYVPLPPVAEKVVANAQRHQSGGTIEKVRRHIAAATAFES
jgi:hypothetical protein